MLHGKALEEARFFVKLGLDWKSNVCNKIHAALDGSQPQAAQSLMVFGAFTRTSFAIFVAIWRRTKISDPKLVRLNFIGSSVMSDKEALPSTRIANVLACPDNTALVLRMKLI